MATKDDFKKHFKALVESRNALANEINTEGASLLTDKVEVDKNHKSDCPCSGKGGETCTDTSWKEAMAAIEERLKTQKSRREELMTLDETLTNTEEISMKMESGEVDITGKPVTEPAILSNMIKASSERSKMSFGEKVGNDFYAFLQQIKATSSSDVKSRPVLGTELTKDGQNFSRVASFYANFGTQQKDIIETTTEVATETNGGEALLTAMKSRREAITAKSMFTQHPLAGGDGSLYAPTEVFAGNTGGLCEYIIDDTVDVLPYPPVSFLECIPVRQIPKSYVLYARQTLRINNASGVGESVVLGIDNPTDIAVDFRPLKPESEFGFSQMKAYTITFADTLAVSEEFLEDCPTIADAVETQLMENVRQEFYDQIINGDGSDGEYPEILGLLAQVGLSTRVHRGAASFFGNTMTSGSVDDNIRETIVRAIFDAQAYGYNVDCILMSHDDYVDMYFLKDGNERPLYTDAELNTIQGAKVRKDIRMPAGTALVGAFRQVVQMLIRRSMRLDIGWVDKQFRQDMLTLRATMRGGLLVKAPHALTRITGL